MATPNVFWVSDSFKEALTAFAPRMHAITNFHSRLRTQLPKIEKLCTPCRTFRQ
jgi:hypothetical protein